MDFMLLDRYLRRAGCLSALLRVPRAARSSLTCAKRSGNPLSGAGFADAQAGSPRYMTHFAAMGVACPTQRSQGGARRAGDMSGVGYAVPMASPAHYTALIWRAQQLKQHSI